MLAPDPSEPEAFDSMRIDDAAVIVRDGGVWLYYKGRSLSHGDRGPGMTRMGVAIAPAGAGSAKQVRGCASHA